MINSGSVYNRQYNPAIVLMQYIGYLRRNPNESPDTNYAGYDFWLTSSMSIVFRARTCALIRLHSSALSALK